MCSRCAFLEASTAFLSAPVEGWLPTWTSLQSFGKQTRVQDFDDKWWQERSSCTVEGHGDDMCTVAGGKGRGAAAHAQRSGRVPAFSISFCPGSSNTGCYLLEWPSL
eukprot:TRINITY_DN41367_c0_g1_i2.p2 TRINITY_DN41367_c0_g1~~TRINITY_DN41367_c0_g1_i2.p2  ORF type:complete len:107 (-),score=14.73 TRINITY_DN41367_c0_g1_i2:211-531(-)